MNLHLILKFATIFTILPCSLNFKRQTHKIKTTYYLRRRCLSVDVLFAVINHLSRLNYRIRSYTSISEYQKNKSKFG